MNRTRKRPAVTMMTTVIVTCHALNSDPSRRGLCGTELGHVPGPIRFVGTATKRSDVLDGRIRLQCSRRDCRTWNVFELVAE